MCVRVCWGGGGYLYAHLPMEDVACTGSPQAHPAPGMVPLGPCILSLDLLSLQLDSVVMPAARISSE